MNVVVRPEDMRIGAAAGDSDIVDLGAFVRYQVRLRDGQNVMTHSIDRTLQDTLFQGAEISFGWSSANHRVTDRASRVPCGPWFGHCLAQPLQMILTSRGYSVRKSNPSSVTITESPNWQANWPLMVTLPSTARAMPGLNMVLSPSVNSGFSR